MHLAAFVDDVAAADHRLTVQVDDPTPDLRATIADGLPAAAVSLEDARPGAPARLGLLDDGSLVLRVGDDDSPETGLVVGPDLSLTRPTSNAASPLGAVDETTFTAAGGSRALIDAATRGVASLATAGDTLHLGLGGSAREQSALRSASDGTVHVYGDADASGAATGPASTAGELEDARFAVVDAADRTRRAAVLAVPDDAGYRGFLTARTALVDDLAGYLDRSYAHSGSWDARARQT